MIGEVGSVPVSIPHRLAAAAGALYWNKAGTGASRTDSAGQDPWTDQFMTVHPSCSRVLPNNSALPSNRSARSIRALSDFTPAATSGSLLRQAPLAGRPDGLAIADRCLQGYDLRS
jgi:hypothetical protein